VSDHGCRSRSEDVEELGISKRTTYERVRHTIFISWTHIGKVEGARGGAVMDVSSRVVPGSGFVTDNQG